MVPRAVKNVFVDLFIYLFTSESKVLPISPACEAPLNLGRMS